MDTGHGTFAFSQIFVTFPDQRLATGFSLAQLWPLNDDSYSTIAIPTLTPLQTTYTTPQPPSFSYSFFFPAIFFLK